MNHERAQQLPFFLTPGHECSYYPERTARTVFGDPQSQPDRHMQTALAANGFRRSGRYIYKPQCAACQDCIPVRVPVADFRADRSQRRCAARNADLHITIEDRYCDDETLALYNRYQYWRHPGGQMVASGSAHFADFLLSDWSDTGFLRCHLDDRLMAVAVFDRLDNALSAVYTFYEPTEATRSLGTFAILKLIELAAHEGLDWVYLGYWLPGHEKMDYKRRFRPLEVLDPVAGWVPENASAS